MVYTEKKTRVLCIIGGLAAGFLNGIFGAGGGTVIVPFLELCLGYDQKESHATAVSVILAFSAVSLFFYLRAGIGELAPVCNVSIGGVFGGVVGAKLLARMRGAWIHRIFGICMIAAAVRMVFGR